jgi:hypothetical protein
MIGVSISSSQELSRKSDSWPPLPKTTAHSNNNWSKIGPEEALPAPQAKLTASFSDLQQSDQLGLRHADLRVACAGPNTQVHVDVHPCSNNFTLTTVGRDARLQLIPFQGRSAKAFQQFSADQRSSSLTLTLL